MKPHSILIFTQSMNVEEEILNTYIGSNISSSWGATVVTLNATVSFQTHPEVFLGRVGDPGTMQEPILIHIGMTNPRKPPTMAPLVNKENISDTDKMSKNNYGMTF